MSQDKKPVSKKTTDEKTEYTQMVKGKSGAETTTKVRLKLNKDSLLKVFLYCLWVVVAFYGVQLVISLLIYLLPEFSLPAAITPELESFIMTAVIFAATVSTALTGPALVRKSPLKGRILDMLGLEQRLPRWRDIGLAITAYISCFAAAIGLAVAVQILFPSIDMEQAQSLPFDQTQFYAGLSLVWIYLTLGVAAPVGEELIFRGYLFGRIRRFLPASITIVITAIIFSLLHIIGFDETGAFQAQWNVVIAILPLSIGLGILREYTGSVWASIILHAIQNTISFLLLFVVLPTQGLF